MKTLFSAFAALGLSLSLPSAAQAMECCKDGKCECCNKENDAPAPAPEEPHQH
jgi:hypothetical protein